MVRNWVGRHHYSTWMIVASVVVMAMTVHPSLLAYLLVALNTGWMIVTREFARSEGVTQPMCRPCLVGGFVILGIAAFLLLKVNWLAI